ncbi:serine-type endopeptidase [Pseudohyphozyma bogoriensis]|nr:serine-type endopeptidase [Pseudohyphozyma bogoriensis]
MTNHQLPPVLPILPLPVNQVLYPGVVLSLQIARPESVALIKDVLRDAEERPGNPPLLIACVPLRGDSKPSAPPAPAKNSARKLTVVVTPPSSESDNDDPAIPRTKAIVPFRPSLGKVLQEDLFEFGVGARIIRLERSTSGGFLALVEGLQRIQITDFTSAPDAPFHEGSITPLSAAFPADVDTRKLKFDDLGKEAESILEHATEMGVKLPSLVARRVRAFVRALNATTAPVLVDVLFGHIPLTSTLNLTFNDKLDILQLTDPAERIKRATEILTKVNQTFSVQKSIGEKVDASLGRRQREFLLLQQLQAIRTELEELAANDPSSPLRGKLPPSKGAPGLPRSAQEEEEEDEDDDMSELDKKIKAKVWTEEAGKAAKKEFKRLKKTPPQGAEYGVIRNYLDWLLSMPWTEESKLVLEKDFIELARKKLDDDHYGLEKIKKRLLEWLAVLRLKQEHWEAISSPTASTEVVPSDAKSDSSAPAPVKPNNKAPILLLCGPPGTGKTSIARSLAESMGRKFHRISLGGVRDEAELRGHRRTYVAALPGAIAMAMRKTGVKNPVILLDEIDKLGMSNTHGDPAAALLEILDPEQNNSFVDHYLSVPLDLSNVLFIATANSLQTISDPLYDRMEIIELAGYVHEEKLHIARKYLIPKQMRENMLPEGRFEISDDVLLHLITSYTREAGVRTTEREIGGVVRAKAVEWSERRDKTGEEAYKSDVTKDDLRRILGRERYEPEGLDGEVMVGVSTGLAYQGSGNGGILHIESTTMPGTGQFHLTGQLGEVISESAQLAFAWMKSHAFDLGISTSREEDVFRDIDVHIHLPAGSIRKDGPSAGVAFVVAVVSLMRGIPSKKATAMTGEVTLRGMVNPVGGIKEKVLGAHRAGVRTIILPHKNEKDLDDLPKAVREEMKFVLVRNVWQALEAAFGEGVLGLGTKGAFVESHL